MRRAILFFPIVILCLVACRGEQQSKNQRPEISQQPLVTSGMVVSSTQPDEAKLQWLEIKEFEAKAEEEMMIYPISEKATVLSTGDIVYIENDDRGYSLYYQEANDAQRNLIFRDRTEHCYVHQIVSNGDDEVFFSTTYGFYQYLGGDESKAIIAYDEMSRIQILYCSKDEIIYIAGSVFGKTQDTIYKYDFDTKINTLLLEGESLDLIFKGSDASDYVYCVPLIDARDKYILLCMERFGVDEWWGQDDYEFYISGDSRYALFYNEKEKLLDLVNLQTHKIITIKDCADELEEIIDQHFFLSDTTLTFFRGKSVETYDILTHEIKRINTLNLDGEDIFYYGFDHGIMGEDGNTVYWNVLEGVGPDEEEINQIADWWVVAYHIDTNEITVLEHHDERPYVWTDGPEWYYFWEKWRDRIVLLSYRTGTSDYNIEYEINQN